MLCVATSGFVWPFRGQFGDDDDDDYDNYDGTALPSISLIVVFSLNLPTSKRISSWSWSPSSRISSIASCPCVFHTVQGMTYISRNRMNFIFDVVMFLAARLLVTWWRWNTTRSFCWGGGQSASGWHLICRGPGIPIPQVVTLQAVHPGKGVSITSMVGWGPRNPPTITRVATDSDVVFASLDHFEPLQNMDLLKRPMRRVVSLVFWAALTLQMLKHLFVPIGSMYGMFTSIVNVGKYV